MELLQRQAKLKWRRCIFTVQVVIWLMIVQHIQPKGTLTTAVDALLAGVADRLLSRCPRAQEKRISRRTGGYSHARQRLPKVLCKQVVEELITRLREILHPAEGPVCYVVDGSSLELEASPSLRKAYPPITHQHGRAHWPILKIVVLHEVETGLAEEPRWGPMYGPKAVSEQSLANAAMAALCPGSVLIGDRNFGVFTIAWEAQQRGLNSVIRLTTERAQKIAGGPIPAAGEKSLTWTASRWDGRRQGGVPKEACVPGRLISARMGRGKSKQWVHLFTTLSWPAPEVLKLYGKRWRIETDLRSLKRTVRLQHVAARKESMMEKEILTAIAAYNLVRAIMALAARRHNLAPRQLSFAFAMTVVNSNWHRLQNATGTSAYPDEVFNLLDICAQGVHPKRKRRSFPREVWPHGDRYPTRKEVR
jgi:hypothetical protein